MTNPRDSKKFRAAVVFNPLKVDQKRLRRVVTAQAKSAGWAETVWFETTARDAGQAVTKSALRRNADVVLAAGGDGTVRAVAEALRRSGVPMAVVPSGTGNLLARNLDLPLSNLESSVRTAFTGGPRTLDLGIVEITHPDGATSEHAFLVMAGLGLDAKMVKNTSTRLKKAVGWLAYVDGIARSLPELKPVRVTYQLEGGPLRAMNVHTIIVGNCGVLPGGFLLMPDAKPDDGLLNVAALRPRGPFGWAKVWRKLAWENGVLRKSSIGRRIIDLSKDVRDVTYLTTPEITLGVAEPQEFQLDGDEFGRASTVRALVDPGALLVMVPKRG
ncbi:MAG: diacylglycerol kinase family protein [Rhodoglobus sp.]